MGFIWCVIKLVRMVWLLGVVVVVMLGVRVMSGLVRILVMMRL